MDMQNTASFSVLKGKLEEKGWPYKYDHYKDEFKGINYLNRVDSPAVSIVIIAWRFLPEILENIEALNKQRYNNFELIFVNNGAEENTFDRVYPFVDTVVHLNRNTGAYLARNLGALFANSEILLFIDDDGLAHHNMVQAHLNAHRTYNVIAVRGVVYGKTDNPANSKAKHYNLGPRPFPVYADVEGNASYLASTFFQAGGWDDEIIFGGGGFELSLRLNKLDSDKRKQIYIPDAILYHDYCDDEVKLKAKLERQAKSRERLKILHPNYDRFMQSWIPFRGRDDVLIRKNDNVNSVNHIIIDKGSIDANLKRIQTMVSGKTAYTEEIEKALELVDRGLKRAAIPRLRRLLKYNESYDVAKEALLKIGETDIPEKENDSVLSHSQMPYRYKISVLIPTYNRCKYLDLAIYSALGQSVSPYEVVVVDDGSTDETEKIVKTIKDSRLRYVLKEHSGAPQTRNRAIAEARGDFILWLDSDDFLLENVIADYSGVLDKYKNVDVIYGNLLVVEDDLKPRKPLMYPDWYMNNEALVARLIQSNGLPNPSTLIRKSSFDKVGLYDIEFKRAHDYNWWVRSAKLLNFKHSGVFTLLWRWHDSNMSTGSVNIDYSYDARIIRYMLNEISLQELYPMLDWNGQPVDEVKAMALLAAAQKLLELGDISGGIGCLNIANASNPHANIQNLIDSLKSKISSDELDTEIILYDEEVKEKVVRKYIPKVIKRKTSSGEYTLGQFKAVIPEKMQEYPRRVLIVCHDFPPYHWAGAQMYALDLAKGLKDQGVDVEVFHGAFRGEFQPDYQIHRNNFQGIPVNILAKENSLEHERLINPRVERAFSDFLDKNHFDIIHFHGLGQLSYAPVFVAKSKNIKTVYSYHDMWPVCHQWFMLKPDGSLCSGPETPEKCAKCYLNKLAIPENEESLSQAIAFTSARFPLAKEALSKIDLHLSPSRYYGSRMEKYGVNIVHLHPNSMKEASPLEKTKRDKFTFGYFGQISRLKGLDVLLNAFETPELSDCQLNVHGNIKDPEFSQAMFEKMNRMPNVTWFGKYTPEALPRIMADMDISVVPTRMDNFPLIIMESYQHNTPVIASDAGGVPEMVKEGISGLIFTSEDVVGLREKLIWAKSNPEKIQEMGENLPRVLNVDEDARLTHKLYYDLINSDKESDEKIKVLFYFFKNVHASILLPIYEELKKLPEFEIGFALHPYNLEIRAGFLPEEEAELRKTPVNFYDNPREFDADISLIADNVAPLLDGCGKIINVGHGLLSKGQYFTDTDFINRENLEDILCVPGEYHRQKILQSRKVFIPVIATGFAKLDRLFNGSIGTRDSLLRANGLDPTKRVILFAPTFNDELSAIPILKDSISVLADENTYLLIKLHGSTKAEYKSMYRELSAKNQNTVYMEDSDLAPSLLMADVMVSDVSSAFMEFMALDKPVVLFNNPDQQKYQNYDARDIEYAWRDLGIEVNNLEELYMAVQRSFENPAEFSEQRKNYAKQLLANLDGNGVNNIINVIKSLYSGEYNPDRTFADSTAVLLEFDGNIQNLEKTLDSLEDCGENIEVFILDKSSSGALRNIKSKYKFNITVLKNNWVEVSNDVNNHSYIAKIESGSTFEKRKLFRLVNHLRRENNTRVVVPLIYNGPSSQNPMTIFDLGRQVPSDCLQFDQQLRAAMVGKNMPFNGHNGNVQIFKNDYKNIKSLENVLNNKQSQMNGNCVLALDVVIEIPEKVIKSPEINTIARDLFGNVEGNGHLRMALHYENKKNFDKARKFVLEAYKNYPNSEIVREVMIRLGIKPEDEV